MPSIEIPSNLTAPELSLAQTIRDLNIYLFKGYVYDQETGLYYCHTRYYNPKVGRWISIDDVSYLDPESIGGMNLYAYCGNNPVMRVDYYGHFWDTILDVISIGWSLYDFLKKPSLGNLGWLALDVAFALIPFVPSISKLVKGASHIDEVVDVAHGFSKIDGIQDAIVIGNKMSRVEDVARIQDALTYAGYIPLNLFGDAAPLWIKTLARIDNAKWLINHVYDGYRILDIGKDSRTYWAMVKSAYGMEKRILFY